MMWAIVLMLSATPGSSCDEHTVAVVDGEPISRADVRLVQRLESLTGLQVKEHDAFLSALEKKAAVALARRRIHSDRGGSQRAITDDLS